MRVDYKPDWTNRTCKNKKPFISKQECEASILIQNVGIKLEAYQCKVCKRWHKTKHIERKLMGGNAHEEPVVVTAPKPARTLGQVAYDAYFAFSKGKSLISGSALPDWSAQADEIKKAWEVAAIAVHDKVTSI